MKNMFIVVLLIFTVMPAFTQFRDTRWGMTMEEVIEIEGRPVYKNSQDLQYRGTVAGYNAWYVFIFSENKLVAAYYRFIITPSEINYHFEVFSNLDTLLTSKYSEPFEKKTNWENEEYKNNPKRHGMALVLGHVSKVTRWKTDTTFIDHVIQSIDHEIFHRILYRSKKSNEEFLNSLSNEL